MNNLLIAGSQGTPLSVIEKSEYNDWLAKQDQASQNWLKNINYTGDGLAIFPNEAGELTQALFVVSDASHYFSCGDLINQLPSGNYHLNADEKNHPAICFAWLIGAYQFDRYLSKKNEKTLPILSINNQQTVDAAINYVQATSLVRDLVNTPAADMMPEDLAHAAQDLVDEFGGNVKHTIGDELLEQNYPTIHAVGRASVHAPRLIDLTWGDTNHPKVTLVGKGVCFDSGGLDVKPAAGMRNMKKDMGGSAHVLGLARLIMATKLPINLRVLIPAVENAVSGNALRPGDVVVTRKGISVEIDNTDAEGRLVLCDALAEAENDNPDLIIDFATLTGAMRVALGVELPGFFSTSDEVAAGITLAGSKNTDPVWRMPLYTPYRDLLKSTVADMTNCATVPFGGAITAALYLQDFVNKDTDWVHFDVMAFNIRQQSGRPLGGEAFGVRAVFDYLEQRFK
ncbi:leucyl aminopeptidase family protein [Litorilituus lipolyticus]|uniref:Leucyl aminopeptidase family protein n=1 Tax=Litorilituus lipolyticus TaxID=2491017 RepID=A0A502KTG8_9GAMM|nr:leucyl aminopeptidase family protein [Litorilituus lipolyticus]TPH13331.1 leucyl aminopeptidase family protein [Litorilituus lipolyticus]